MNGRPDQLGRYPQTWSVRKGQVGKRSADTTSMTDLAHLPPLPPIGLSPTSQADTTVFPSGPGGDLVAGMTDLAHLPPLHPVALCRTSQASPSQASPTQVPSGRGQNLGASMTVLMAGLVALAWALRLDPSDGQVLVAVSASFTLLAPVATCTFLRSASRRARLQRQ
jgi:hypothetical protein